MTADLVLKITGDPKGADAAINKAVLSIGNLQKTIDKISFTAALQKVQFFYTAAAAGVEKVKGALADINTVLDFGQELGTSTNQIQDLQAAFILSGGSAGEATDALRHFVKQLANAEAGDKFDQSLQSLGLSLQEIRSLSPGTAVNKIADSFQDINDPVLKAKTALDLFGKSGQKVINVLSSGSGGIAAAGQTIGRVTDASLQRGFAAFTEVTAASESIKRSFMETVAALGPLISQFAKITKDAAELFKATTQDLIPIVDALDGIADALRSVIKDMFSNIREFARLVGEDLASSLGLPGVRDLSKGKVSRRITNEGEFRNGQFFPKKQGQNLPGKWIGGIFVPDGMWDEFGNFVPPQAPPPGKMGSKFVGTQEQWDLLFGDKKNGLIDRMLTVNRGGDVGAGLGTREAVESMTQKNRGQMDKLINEVVALKEEMRRVEKAIVDQAKEELINI